MGMEVTGTWKFRDKSIYEIQEERRSVCGLLPTLRRSPEIMFLDEPTTYLDISHQLETMNLVKKIKIARRESVWLWCCMIWRRRWKSAIM